MLSTDLTHERPDSSWVCKAHTVGGLVRSRLQENRPLSAFSSGHALSVSGRQHRHTWVSCSSPVKWGRGELSYLLRG